MDYIAKAGEMNLTGHACKCCGSEVGHLQPVFYDLDGDAGERPTAQVWCVDCWETIQQARCEAFVEAANLCRKYWVPDMAEALMEKAKAIAQAMAEAQAV